MAFDFASARAKHGQLVVVDLDGEELVFRPLKPQEAHSIVARTEAAPEDALDAALVTCRACCLSDLEVFDRLADIYPLAFSGEDGVIGELILVAMAGARIRIKEGVSKWKGADRNPGRMAENLLAFKAYSGGDYSAQELAGALTVAEWMQVTKGTFTLFLSLMRALSKRR